MANWYTKIEGREAGPFTNAELREKASIGFLQPTDMIRKDDGDWVPASKAKGLFAPQPSVPSSQPLIEGAPSEVHNQKPPVKRDTCAAQPISAMDRNAAPEQHAHPASSQRRWQRQKPVIFLLGGMVMFAAVFGVIYFLLTSQGEDNSPSIAAAPDDTASSFPDEPQVFDEPAENPPMSEAERAKEREEKLRAQEVAQKIERWYADEDARLRKAQEAEAARLNSESIKAQEALEKERAEEAKRQEKLAERQRAEEKRQQELQAKPQLIDSQELIAIDLQPKKYVGKMFTTKVYFKGAELNSTTGGYLLSFLVGDNIPTADSVGNYVALLSSRLNYSCSVELGKQMKEKFARTYRGTTLVNTKVRYYPVVITFHIREVDGQYVKKYVAKILHAEAG